MFRFEERQLHSLIRLFFLVSMILFFVIAFPEAKQLNLIQFDELSDFSEGWIGMYQTSDATLLERYYTDDEIMKGNNRISDVCSLPFQIPIKRGSRFQMSNRVPDIPGNNGYCVLETNRQMLEVYVDGDCLYRSSKRDDKMKALHVIRIPQCYQGREIRFVVKEELLEKVSFDKIQFGSASQLITSSLKENGFYFICGSILLLMEIGMVALFFILKTSVERRELLKGACLEGFLFGFVLLCQSRCFQILTGWNYSLYFMRACFILLLGVSHLLVIRICLARRKVCFFVDLGMVLYGILFVSVMVLQAFSLIQFSTVCVIGTIYFCVNVICYTLLLIGLLGTQGRSALRSLLLGNGILLVAGSLHLFISVFNKNNKEQYLIPIACFLYMCIIWVKGLKQISYVKDEKLVEDERNAMRLQVVEEMNPNLVFTSFHVLQNMIKANSTDSVKMLYYISEYFRNNLRALDQSGSNILFEQELEHILAYLQLQNKRNPKLKFSIECKEKQFSVPRHSIEPIVENAVKYGIGGNENQGNVVVRSYQRRDGYAIQIIDDGIGFDTTQLKKKSSTAVLSLFDLLKKECNAQTEIISKPGKGTVVTIVIPVREQDGLS